MPYCEKCGHTGKLPFVKEGRVISNAWVYCDCKEDTENYQEIKPEDYDFPCSKLWRKWFNDIC